MNYSGPNGEVIEFPDDMPVEEVRAAMQKQYPPPGLGQRIGNELLQRGAGMIGGIAHTALHPVDTVTQMVTHPLETAKSMIPMRQSAGQLIEGGPSAVKPETLVGDAAELGLSWLIPKVIQKVGGGVVRGLPGSAVEQHVLEQPRLRAIPKQYMPTKAAEDAAWTKLREAAGGDVKFDMSSFRTRLLDWLQREQKKSPAEQDATRIAYLQQHLQDSVGGWTPEELIANTQSFGGSYGRLQPARGLGQANAMAAREESQMLGDLINAVHDDAATARPVVITQAAVPAQPMLGPGGGPMSNPYTMTPLMTPAQPAVFGVGQATELTSGLKPLWDDARNLSRRRFAATGLARELENIFGVQGEGWTVSNVNPLIKKIQNARGKAAAGGKTERSWVESFAPGELDDIVETLRESARRLPLMTKKAGTITGSSERIPQAIAGSMAGTVLGGPGVLAAEVGAYAGTKVPNLIARAMMSKGGRALVRFAVQEHPVTSPVFQHTLAAYLRAETAQQEGQPLDEPAPVETPTPSNPFTPTPTPTPAPAFVPPPAPPTPVERARTEWALLPNGPVAKDIAPIIHQEIADHWTAARAEGNHEAITVLEAEAERLGIALSERDKTKAAIRQKLRGASTPGPGLPWSQTNPVEAP